MALINNNIKNVYKESTMDVVRQSDINPEDASDAPLFYGGKVTRQPLIGGSRTDQFNFSLVSFYGGAKNHFDTHTSDQILYATGWNRHCIERI